MSTADVDVRFVSPRLLTVDRSDPGMVELLVWPDAHATLSVLVPDDQARQIAERILTITQEA